MRDFNICEDMSRLSSRLISLNRKIWEFAETRFQEYKSSEAIKNILREEKFSIKSPVADMETAFIATYGNGFPTIAILAEYDALSGLSQVGESVFYEPIINGGNGHGCGHNILGTSSVGAAITVKRYIENNKIKGTVMLIGCPAEEGGSGKTYMARAGVFSNVDIALVWHPAAINSILSTSSLANYQIYFKFKGKASHACASPHMGRSALDAVELMNIGSNYLREHIVPEARLHYAITNTGGNAPNVVQANAEVLYLIRAPYTNQVDDIYKRICKIAKGAALMTETKLEIVFDKACSNTIPNRTIEEVIHKNMLIAGGPKFVEKDYAFAKAVQDTFSNEEREEDLFLSLFSSENNFKEKLKEILSKSLSEEVLPYMPLNFPMSASTDVGDVSWVAPTAQFTVSCFAVGTPAHSWQMVSQSNSSIAEKGMLKAVQVLAMTAIDFLKNQDKIMEAKNELQNKIGKNGYHCPIPNYVKPASGKNR